MRGAIAGAVVICTSGAACARAPVERSPWAATTPLASPSDTPAPPPPSAEAPSGLDDAFVVREAEALAALRRSRREIVLLEPSGVVLAKGRFPSRWKEADGILLRLHETPTTYDDDLVPGISFSWASPGIDGGMYLVLTDEDLWLQSGHDNPHESHLYWLARSSAAQRAAVAKVLAKRSVGASIECGRSGDSVYSSHASSAAEDCRFRAPHRERTAFGDDHVPVTTKNVAALLATLNKALPKDVAPLPIPSAADLERRVLLAGRADELRDWLHAE